MLSPDVLRRNLQIAIRYPVVNKEIFVGTDGPAFSRRRKLGMEETMTLLHLMSGGPLKKELCEAGVDISASAFVQSRSKIPSEAFRMTFRWFNHLCRSTDWKTYRGYRLLAVDGSCINMAFDQKAPSFVRSDTHPKGGYNQLHLNTLYDVENGVYYDAHVTPQPRVDEIGALITMLRHNDFQRKQLIICDRGYESYHLMAQIMRKRNVDFLIRVKQNKSAMREVAKLPMEELDVDVSFTITTTQTNKDKENGYIFIQTHANKKRKYSAKTKPSRWTLPSPYPMSFRVVRFLLPSGEYETVATSLPRSFSAEEIKELYHRRWGIEIAFRNLKYSLGLSNLHGKSQNMVEQEIYSAMTINNFCARIVNSIILRKKEGQAYTYKINYKMAVYLCRKYLKDPDMCGSELLRLIAKYIEPVRPGRADQRRLQVKGFSGFLYRIAA